MEDKNFDKFVKKILESPPKMTPPAADVEDMRYKLRAAMEQRRRRRFLFFFLPLLVAPFLIGTYFLFNKYNYLNNEIINLQQQLNKKVIIDSTLQKHITYQFDTIHNVIYTQEYSLSQTGSESLSKFRDKIYSIQQRIPERFWRSDAEEYFPWGLDNSGPSLLLPAPSSSFYSSPFGPSRKNYPGNSSLSLFIKEALSLLDDQPYQRLANIPLTEQFAINEEYLNDPDRGGFNPLYHIVPTGFRAKLNANPLIETNDIFGGGTYALGLKGEIQFVNNRSLILGIEYLNRKFETKDLSNFSLFPLIAGNDPQDILFELKPDLNYIQFPVILQQKFLKDKKLNPSISAGFVSYRPVTQKIVYEFFDSNGEYKLNETYREGSFSFDNLRVGIGAEYRLGTKFSIDTGVQYQHGFSQQPGEFFKLRYWAWDFNLNYKIF